MIASQKRKPNGIGIAAGMVPIRKTGSLPPVGQVGAKSEKLKGAEETGQRPKRERIPLSGPKKKLHRNRYRKDARELLPAEIVPEEMQVPAQITRAAFRMKIGVVPRDTGCGVMPVVLAQEMSPIKARIKKNADPPCPGIESGAAGRDHSMHGIMSSDE